MTIADQRLLHATYLEAQRSADDGRQAQIHTSHPGRIVDFDPATMTATVQLAIQGVRTKRDGTRENVTIAPLQHVPVFFPGGGGHSFTFPISAGDDCIVLFQERNIDAWYQHGSTTPLPPPDFRMHDINDGIALLGSRSQPNVLGGGGDGPGSGGANAPQTSTKTTQLRSNDGKTVIDIDGSANMAITLSGNTAAVVFVDGKDEAVTIQANNGVQIQGTASGSLGFFNASPVPKMIVTGSKQGNPALTSLLAALRIYGLIIDNTT